MLPAACPTHPRGGITRAGWFLARHNHPWEVMRISCAAKKTQPAPQHLVGSDHRHDPTFAINLRAVGHHVARSRARAKTRPTRSAVVARVGPTVKKSPGMSLDSPRVRTGRLWPLTSYLWALRDPNPRTPPCKASEAERCAQSRFRRSGLSETRTVRG